MELHEALRRRAMVRSYDPDRPVPPEAIEELAWAALRGPSAGNTRGVSLLVLDRPEQVTAFWAATAGPGPPDRWLSGMRTAPALLLVWTTREGYLDRYAQPDKGWTDRDPERWSAPYWFVDAGMAAMAVLLAAVDLGLGACFFGVPPQRVTPVRETFGVPLEQLSVGVISVGYRATLGGSGRAATSLTEARRRVHIGRWSDVE